MLFRDVLASFKTKHTGDENRNTNLRLACETINGLVLNAGENFDFNTVVGQRTAAKGYKAADAYDGGQTVKTLGGGICQVSSTLYYCTLIADLQIINRSPHSYISSYMDPGTDATVSWGGPHFTFKNNTNYPIRIEAKVEDGYVHMALIGTDEKDYYVEIEYQIIGSEAPETIYKDFEVDNEEGYKNGQVITTPYTGYTVKTFKLKYDKVTKELISREVDQISRYRKRDKVVARVNVPTEPPTEAPEEPPVVTPTEPATPPVTPTEPAVPPVTPTEPTPVVTTPPPPPATSPEEGSE
jgi:vancomycin resistance protein YoaR